jgi:hypothetical protein
MATVQTPLSSEAEERVAGVASLGESSTPCDLRRFYLQSPPDLNTQDHKFYKLIVGVATSN